MIELDPNHAEARHALGYSQLDGQWVTRDEVMIQRGYVKYKGKWMLPQEKELIEKKHEQEAAQQEWFRKLKLWRGWLGGDRDQQARENIRAIDDPVAVKALTIGLRDDSAPPVRILYVNALARIDTPEAARALAIASISDPVEEVRLTCLDRLQTKKRPDVVAYFVGKLTAKKSTNEVINLAGLALGRMKDPSAIGPLIDALVTIHKFKIAKPGGDNATSSTFGTGPGGRGAPGGGGIGMSAGGGPTIISQAVRQPGRARCPGGANRPELQLRPAGLAVLVRRAEETGRSVRPAAELAGPAPGGPDSLSIGAAKPQEVLHAGANPLVPDGTPIAKLSGPPAVSSSLDGFTNDSFAYLW